VAYFPPPASLSAAAGGSGPWPLRRRYWRTFSRIDSGSLMPTDLIRLSYLSKDLVCCDVLVEVWKQERTLLSGSERWILLS